MASGTVNSRNGFARSSDMVIPRRDADHSDQVALSLSPLPHRRLLLSVVSRVPCIPGQDHPASRSATHRITGSASRNSAAWAPRRPCADNLDQVALIFSAATPSAHTELLPRFAMAAVNKLGGNS
jgi:hypothetical protein